MKKGEKTRLEVLEATLKTMVDKGVHATTFRAVAERASIKTSLVAYHFPDRTVLLRDAVSMLFSRQATLIDQLFEDLFTLIKPYSPSDFKRAICRAEIALWLTDAVTDVLLNYYLSEQVDPRCLLILKFDTHPDPALIHVRNLGHRSLKLYLTELTKRLNTENPSQDALLMAAVFTIFELEAVKTGARDYQKIHQTLWQTLSKILNVSGNLTEVTKRVKRRTTPAYSSLLAQSELLKQIN